MAAEKASAVSPSPTFSTPFYACATVKRQWRGLKRKPSEQWLRHLAGWLFPEMTGRGLLPSCLSLCHLPPEPGFLLCFPRRARELGTFPC